MKENASNIWASSAADHKTYFEENLEAHGAEVYRADAGIRFAERWQHLLESEVSVSDALDLLTDMAEVLSRHDLHSGHAWFGFKSDVLAWVNALLTARGWPNSAETAAQLADVFIAHFDGLFDDELSAQGLEFAREWAGLSKGETTMEARQEFCRRVSASPCCGKTGWARMHVFVEHWAHRAPNASLHRH